MNQERFFRQFERYISLRRFGQACLVLLIGVISSVGFSIEIPIDISGTLEPDRVLGTFIPLMPLTCAGVFYKSEWPGNFERSCSGRRLEVFRGTCSAVSAFAPILFSGALLLVGAEYSIASSSFWVGILGLGIFHIGHSFLSVKKSFLISFAVTLLVVVSPMVIGANNFSGDGLGADISSIAKLFYLGLFAFGVVLMYFPVSVDAGGK